MAAPFGISVKFPISYFLLDEGNNCQGMRAMFRISKVIHLFHPERIEILSAELRSRYHRRMC